MKISAIIVLIICFISLSCKSQIKSNLNYPKMTLGYILNNLEENNLKPILIYKKTESAKVFYKIVGNDQDMLSKKLDSWNETLFIYKDTIIDGFPRLKTFRTNGYLDYKAKNNICDLNSKSCDERETGDLTLIVTKEITKEEFNYIWVFIHSEGLNDFITVMLFKYDNKGELRRVISTQGNT